MTLPVSENMRAVVIEKLDEIEREENVRILFAVESGSRAWGFHSPDSDFDVRFVYARARAWHYQLGKKRDVIEKPIDDELDISGWELGKALELSLGSNAVIAEWLQSPIVYRKNGYAVEKLTEFARDALSRKSVTWHYVSLLKRQQSRLTAPDGSLRVKRWFYILRPALALRWLRLNDQAMPPMNMDELRAGTDLQRSESASIDALLVLKAAAHEKATMASVDPGLENLVAEELILATEWLKQAKDDTVKSLRERASTLHLDLSEIAFSNQF